MSDDDDLLKWLLDELDEEFAAGLIGLHIFIWILHARMPDATVRERSVIARQALQCLLLRPDFELVWMTWHPRAINGLATLQDVTDAAWEDPVKDPYLAVALRSELPPNLGSADQPPSARPDS